MNVVWVAIAYADLYIMPVPEQGIFTRWREKDDIAPCNDRQCAINAVRAYADEHNLIRAFVTPKLHERSVREWERRNNKSAPPLAL